MNKKNFVETGLLNLKEYEEERIRNKVSSREYMVGDADGTYEDDYYDEDCS